jgi:ActR/RegA family two-component response regulator
MDDKVSRTWKRVAMDSPVKSHAIEARRALVLHDRPLLVDLITLTLNHGVFAVRAASTLAEADAILRDWSPHLAVIDMDHDDSTGAAHAPRGLERDAATRNAGPRAHANG